MPLSIPVRHFDRIFGFRFLDELTDRYKELTPLMRTFVLKTCGQDYSEEDYKEDIAFQKETIFKTTGGFPITTIDIGDVMALYNMVPVRDLQNGHIDDDVRKHRMLLVQYYDTEKQPVFSKDTGIENIRNLPALSIDSPNILVALLNVENQTLDLIKAPDWFLERYQDDISE